MQPTGVLSRQQLADIAAERQRSGQLLVLTNGCFDLLHVGHVRYLIASRSLGASLAVGINSDESVRRLKGHGRPLTPQDDRAEILAALACVDYVTIFDEPTAAELVAVVRPAIYVKGGDYSANPAEGTYPPEGRIVTEYGGRVEIIPYVAGHSTSAIIQAVEANRAP
jgi:rfaE bifunctional protein nucleotidyltransferase chain/domain